MKYRTKIYLFLMGTSSAVLVVALGLSIHREHKMVLKDLKSQVIAIAATAATNLNGNLIEHVRVLADEQTPAYLEARAYLQNVRNSNRNERIWVKFVYTMYPDPNHSGKFLFGVDAEEWGEADFAHPGGVDVASVNDIVSAHLNEEYSTGTLVKGQWGTWLTGYAPIYNSKGEYAGTMAVDISAEFVAVIMNRMYLSAAVILLVALFLSAMVASLLAKRATLALRRLAEATHEIGTGNFAYRVDVKTGDEFQDLGESMNQMCMGLQEKERMKVGFAHYVSKAVLEKVMVEGAPQLTGERRKITVFFCDIRDFTKLAERLSAEAVLGILNEYFQVMIDIVFKNNGMIDKLIGDAIMAEFGYPAHDANQERNAVLTALEMQRALVVLREKWKREGKPLIEIGVGIHSGEAVVGTVGSKDRVEFTAIGDTVNIASRLESATRVFNEGIIISEETFNALNNEFPSKALGAIELKGKDKKINAYALLY